MISRLGALTMLVVAALPLACSTSDSGGPKVGPGFKVTKAVDGAGAMLAVEGATLVVPPGTLKGAVTLGITRLDEGTPTGYDAYSPLFQFDPEGAVLAGPVTVSIAITRAGADLRAATIFWRRQGTTGYERLEAQVVDGVATVQVSQLSQGFVANGIDYADPADRSCARTSPIAKRELGSDSSGVALFFAADDCQGRPLANLACAELPGNCDFVIEEDGHPLDAEAAGSLRRTDGLQGFVTLLFDLSSLPRQHLVQTIDAARAFVTRIQIEKRLSVHIGVQVFAGQGSPTEWQAATLDSQKLLARLGELKSLKFEDGRLRNSNGAIIGALQKQAWARRDFEQRNFGGAFTVGYVILFTDGLDGAGLVTPEEVRAAAAANFASVLAVTLKAKSFDRSALQTVASQVWVSPEPASLFREFSDVANRVAGQMSRIYGVGYCSPQRSGRHAVSIAVKNGAVPASDALASFVIDAKGFGPGCDAKFLAQFCEGKQCAGVACGACDDRTAACERPTGTCRSHCAASRMCEGVTFTNPLGYQQTCTDLPEARRCGASCVDTTRDGSNCGACGNACPQGAWCEEGHCRCQAAQFVCDGKCVDTTSDPAHCGGCGMACNDARVACVASACSCPLSQSVCGSACVDLSSDPLNCGQCGNTCPENQLCFGTCTEDLEWANWPVPPVSPAGYTAESETVRDDVTGLVWQRVVPSQNYAWAAAKIYCAGLSLSGQTGWRLPTIVELLSIVDLGTSNPAIDASAFPNTPLGNFWTTTPFADQPAYVWLVNFGVGSSLYDVTASLGGVRCVR